MSDQQSSGGKLIPAGTEAVEETVAVDGHRAPESSGPAPSLLPDTEDGKPGKKSSTSTK